jgi:hypothetical protein
MLFAKLSKQCLRRIRVATVEELEARILQYIAWVNEDPGPFRWRWTIESAENPEGVDEVAN